MRYLSILLLFVINLFCSQSIIDNGKKTFVSFSIDGKKEEVKNIKIFLTNEKDTIVCKIINGNEIYFPLSKMKVDKKYTLNVTNCKDNMQFTNIDYNLFTTDQDREFKFEIEKKPFKKAKNLSKEVYKEKKLIQINFFKIDPYERGSGIMLLEKKYK